MKRMILIAAVLVLAGWERDVKATLAEIYFPLSVGNSWTYTNYLGEPGEPDPRRPPPSIELTFTIIGTEEIDGYIYYKFDNYFSILPPPPNGDEFMILKNILFRSDLITDKVLSYGSIEDDRIRYDFTGDKWNPDTGIGWCQLKETNVTCNVPAGEFSDCIKFQFGLYPSAGPDAAAYGEYLAPNIGMIKFVRPGGDYPDRLEGQDVTFILKSYTIVPEPGSLLLSGLGALLLRKRS
jgi:hypothetical protein